MAIDDPVDAVESQYRETAELPAGLVLSGLEMAIPQGSLLFKLLGLLNDHFSSKGKWARAQAFWNALRDKQKFLEADFEKLRVQVDDLAEAIQIAIVQDADSFNDDKRDRYLRILGNAVRSEQEIRDLASFIRDVEQLGDRDIVVLKVLNIVMNKVGDWQPAGGASLGAPGGSRPFVHKPTSVHPNIFIQRSHDLGEQIAKALGENTNVNIVLGQQFGREEGYSLCARLQGFGLAHEAKNMDREVPHGDYCFRPSRRGLLLLKLLGEDVPNWTYYFPPTPRP